MATGAPGASVGKRSPQDAVVLATIRKMTADSKAHRQTYDHHIDWDAPTPAAA